jgi:hypothetical protein
VASKGRPLWMSTSWEMNKTLAEADSFVDELLTFTVAAASSPFAEGSWTGEISMVKDAGARPCGPSVMVERKGWRHASLA